MLRYEWVRDAVDPNGVTDWKVVDGSGDAGIKKVKDLNELGLTKFAEQTEAYFRGLDGTFTVRVVNEERESLWQGNTKDGFAFLFKPVQGRRFRR